MTQYARVNFQLHDHDNVAISSSGGQVQVNTAGSAAKATLYDKNGVAASNPVALTAGGAEFYVASTIATVDLYIQAPHGQFAVKKSVAVGGAYEYEVDTDRKDQVFVIPFSYADSVAATEKSTGFRLPAYSQVLGRLSGCGIRVTTADATETIDVGTLESGGAGGGDANGFNAAAVLDNAAQLIGTNGALFSTNAPYLADVATEKLISYTLTAGSDTAAGFIILPVVLETA